MMKGITTFRNLWIITFLAVVFPVMFIATPKALAGDSTNITGWLDGVSCNAFDGWSVDKTNCSNVNQVDFYDENWNYIGSATAGNYRQDLVNANVCNSTGNHGFSWSWYGSGNWLRDGGTHSIRAYGVNTSAGYWHELQGSPKTISGCYLTLSGRVTDQNGNGISGVILNQGYDSNPGPPACFLGTKTTDSSGNFSFPNIAYNHGFCLRSPSSGVSGYTLTSGGYECQTAGRKYGPPDSCGATGGNGDRDMTTDNAYNFTYTLIAPPTPTITKNVSCVSGSYSGNQATISWTNPGVSVSYADISTSNNFSSFYNKYVGGTTSTNLSGFNGFWGVSGALILQPNTIYYVRLYNGAHSGIASFSIPLCATPTPTPSPTLTPPPCDTTYKDNKFHVCYFNGTNPESGSILSQEDEGNLSSPIGSGTAFQHTWGASTVGNSGKTDQVSAIWRGKVNFQAGNYVFHAASDDGVTLDVEGYGQIINEWRDQGTTTFNSATYNIPAGYRNVAMRWYENGGHATARLWWDYTSIPTPTPTPLPTPTPIPQDPNCPSGSRPIQIGNGFLSLVDTSKTTRFSSLRCLIGRPAAVPQFSLPNYDELKSLYYDQSKTTFKTYLSGNRTQADLNPALHPETDPYRLFVIDGSLEITNNLFPGRSRSAPVVIFVRDNLTIKTGIDYGSGTYGVIFIVGQNIRIKDTVSRVDAMMITSRQFCSSWNEATSTCLSANRQLVINGSVIALPAADGTVQDPQFLRTNGFNTNPAEEINYQPKYLIILKDIFARDLTIWNEIQ